MLTAERKAALIAKHGEEKGKIIIQRIEAEYAKGSEMSAVSIHNRVKGLNDDSTVGEFQDIVSGMLFNQEIEKAEMSETIKELESKCQKIMESQIRPNAVHTLTPEEKTSEAYKNFFMGARNFDPIQVMAGGGGICKSTGMDNWERDNKWNVSDPQHAEAIQKILTHEKAQIGTAMRGDAVTGSYTVPTAYETEVKGYSLQASQMMGLIDSRPMGTRESKLIVDGTGVTLTWLTNETTTITETNPTFGSKSLDAETLAAWIAWTDSLEEDSMVSLASYFARKLGEAYGQEFDKQVLTANTDPFTGWLYDTNVVQETLGAGQVGFEDVEFDDLKDMRVAIPSGARAGARYIMSSEVFNIVSKVKNANGDYIYEEAQGGAPPTLCGRPYILADSMPGDSDSAKSTNFIAYGNPVYCSHGQRVGQEFRIFDQTVHAMRDNEIFLRFRTRQAHVVAVPAALCKLRTAAA